MVYLMVFGEFLNFRVLVYDMGFLKSSPCRQFDVIWRFHFDLKQLILDEWTRVIKQIFAPYEK